ncbi:MAG: GNAT family N-acetyltransferase [Clostridiales bacterium]|jgi:GNAT superfamily N-acetyltransferase|nr:GNAT family N-acetyltransferase [Clostridiales bacterium]
MIIKEFTEEYRSIFLDLCRDFYESHAAIKGFDRAIADTTFSRVLDHHENLWGVMLLAIEDGEPLGYALITSYWCNEEGGNVIVLDELYIRKDMRQKGYAKMFMQWLENAYADKAVAVTLEVLTTNQHARDLYIKSGYRPDGFTTYSKPLRHGPEG